MVDFIDPTAALIGAAIFWAGFVGLVLKSEFARASKKDNNA